MEHSVYRYDFRLSEDRLPYLIREKECVVEKDFHQKNSSREIADWADREIELSFRSREILAVLCFSSRNMMLGYFLLTEGTADAAPVSTRDIYIAALSLGASRIAVVHNHPSGFCEPSEPDKAAAEKIREAGKLLDIELMDFLIVGYRDHYFSFSEAGML